MLRESQLVTALELEEKLGIRQGGGACFGVTDPNRLRTQFQSPKFEPTPGKTKRRRKASQKE